MLPFAACWLQQDKRLSSAGYARPQSLPAPRGRQRRLNREINKNWKMLPEFDHKDLSWLETVGKSRNSDALTLHPVSALRDGRETRNHSFAQNKQIVSEMRYFWTSWWNSVLVLTVCDTKRERATPNRPCNFMVNVAMAEPRTGDVWAPRGWALYTQQPKQMNTEAQGRPTFQWIKMSHHTHHLFPSAHSNFIFPIKRCNVKHPLQILTK